jgi:hypothetical protein
LRARLAIGGLRIPLANERISSDLGQRERLLRSQRGEQVFEGAREAVALLVEEAKQSAGLAVARGA